jgi:hypothetical protein
VNTIKEKCSCGAEISVESDWLSSAATVISEWREVHVEHGTQAPIGSNYGFLKCPYCPARFLDGDEFDLHVANNKH